ncbi:hypothetical protein RHMOL_Rhmol04G0134000 [Rhododendron molle]|uniref:Uncharacterized protein n=1 Tax=Rhododendron molle TaxID=49168 RepID=A0ACC0P060_RHOML|nr:hypothetical protein RHMOL_Rhmol04G0134000 [Rhododendron molle]
MFASDNGIPQFRPQLEVTWPSPLPQEMQGTPPRAPNSAPSLIERKGRTLALTHASEQLLV